MKTPQIVLFDLDGTLIDSSGIVVDAYYSGLQELGYPQRSREFIASLAGKSTFETGRMMGIEEDDLPKIDQYFWNYFGEYAEELSDEVPLFDGTRKILAKLHENGIKMGVVTSNEAKSARLLLEKANLMRYFQTVVGKEHTVKRKPEPEPIYYALQQMSINQIDKQEGWFIGDTAADVKAAQNAGLTSIAIPHDHTRELVEREKPDRQFENMNECYEFVKSKLSQVVN